MALQAEQPANEKASGLKQHGTRKKISVVQNDWRMRKSLVNEDKDPGMGPDHKEPHIPWIRVWTLRRIGND